jgi:hypothetical protein
MRKEEKYREPIRKGTREDTEQHKYLKVTPEIPLKTRPSVGKLTGRRCHPVGHFGQGQLEVGT